MSFAASPCYGCGSEHSTVSLCCQRMGAPPFQVAIVDPAARTFECVAGQEADFAVVGDLPPALANIYWAAVTPSAEGQSRLAERLPCAGLAASGECMFEAHKPASCQAMGATPDDPQSRCAMIRAAWPDDPEGGD